MLVGLFCTGLWHYRGGRSPTKRFEPFATLLLVDLGLANLWWLFTYVFRVGPPILFFWGFLGPIGVFNFIFFRFGPFLFYGFFFARLGFGVAEALFLRIELARVIDRPSTLAFCLNGGMSVRRIVLG